MLKKYQLLYYHKENAEQGIRGIYIYVYICVTEGLGH